MKVRLALLLAVLFFSSCVGYHYTQEGGIRVNNPKVFRYNKKKFTSLDKSLIDTNANYLIDSSFNKWRIPQWEQRRDVFIRFFSTGQILFITCSDMPNLDIINNKNLGIPGYFILRGNKIKIVMFQDLNGGQIGKFYGRIQPNGDLVFYDQRPETYYSSFYLLEKAEINSRKSHWKKIKVDKIEHYTPNW